MEENSSRQTDEQCYNPYTRSVVSLEAAKLIALQLLMLQLQTNSQSVP